MSRKIENFFQLKDVCRSAGLRYVGSFMAEYLDNRHLWENKDTKQQFIDYMYCEYEGIDQWLSGTRTRANCMIRIIESGYVCDAMRLVLQANDEKLGCPQSKINAQMVLDAFADGTYTE